MKKTLSNKLSENSFLWKSTELSDLPDGTYDIGRIPRNALVESLMVEKVVAFDGTTATVTMGFTGNKETADPDGFMDAAAVAGRAVGMVDSKVDAQPASKGKYFAAAGGMLTMTILKGDAAVLGHLRVFMRYTIIN